MRYEFQCTDDTCRTVTEVVCSMKNRPETVACSKCGKEAKQVILTPPAISRVGMSNEPFDVAVGRSAAARWEEIAKRQAARNQVRRDNHQQGLAATGYTSFKPISSEQQSVRSRAIDSVAKDGHKPDAADPMTALVTSKK